MISLSAKNISAGRIPADNFFAIIGTMGASGAPGGPGQIIYPAGIYNPNAIYTCTDKKAPYVYDPNYKNFYVMNYIGTWNGKDHSGVTPGDDYSKKMRFYNKPIQKLLLFDDTGKIATYNINLNFYNK